ncbi:MAG: polysaccharide pyruvyl transferase CsaB [Armatimonadetes bacterium]|nr:polysaccharide pyruvyl transferase CsaB [Armatimonadota bacterium]
MSLRGLLCGYYGCGNLGDEAVLGGIVHSWAHQFGDSKGLVALSGAAASTETWHGIHAVPRMDARAVRTAMAETDVAVSGGGSLFQDATSVRSLLYYAGYLWLARRMGRPAVVYAQGVGPLHRPLSRTITAAAFRTAALVTVRDPESAELVRRIGGAAARLEVTADPAFALTELPRTEPGGGLAVLALRTWASLRTAADAAKLVRAVQGEGLHRVALLAMHTGDDVALAREAAELAGDGCFVAQLPDVASAIDLVRCASVVVAMRLHALVFAVMAATPVVALSYDPKVKSFMSSARLAAYCTEEFDSARVQALCKSALAAAPEIRRLQAARSVELRREALRTAALVAEVVAR